MIDGTSSRQLQAARSSSSFVRAPILAGSSLSLLKEACSLTRLVHCPSDSGRASKALSAQQIPCHMLCLPCTRAVHAATGLTNAVMATHVPWDAEAAGKLSSPDEDDRYQQSNAQSSPVMKSSTRPDKPPKLSGKCLS